MIVLHDVSCGYGDLLPLRQLRAQWPDRGVVALLGPSGGGKTTLLKLLAGLLRPVAGHVSGLEGKRVSMVFQEDRLLPWRNVRQNVVVAGGQDPLFFLRLVELEEWADKPLQSLSGGMKRRVALARALCYGGDVLLLDEAFRGLDDALRRRIISRMAGLFPLTVLAAHEPREAQELGATTVLYIGPQTNEAAPAD